MLVELPAHAWNNLHAEVGGTDAAGHDGVAALDLSSDVHVDMGVDLGGHGLGKYEVEFGEDGDVAQLQHVVAEVGGDGETAGGDLGVAARDRGRNHGVEHVVNGVERG